MGQGGSVGPKHWDSLVADDSFDSTLCVGSFFAQYIFNIKYAWNGIFIVFPL